jgi:glycosyltransferase involved in cell wall biosynthesis
MESPNRILYICHDGDLYGSQQSLNLIVKYLPKQAYHCFVTIARPGPLQALLEAYPNTTVLAHKRLQWVKHDPRSFLQRIGDAFKLLILALPRTLHVFNTIRREKINVVHTNSTVSLEGALAAALAGIPHIWHIRELFMEKSPKFHLVLGRRISRWIIERFSDRVICISEAVRSQFGEYAEDDPDKYLVIHNALELPNTEEQIPLLNQSQSDLIRTLSLAALNMPDSKLFRIGYIGRLSEGKGFHELLEAFSILKQRGVLAELAVAGNFVDEAYKARILDAIDENNVRDSVHLLGYREDLTPLYEVINVLVIPSRSEPFGRVVIEAMIQGVPCIGSNAGGIPEIIEDRLTGLLYPPGDTETLADLIEELVDASWKREAIRQNAGRMVRERFNIESQIRTLDECYQSVITLHQF